MALGSFHIPAAEIGTPETAVSVFRASDALTSPGRSDFGSMSDDLLKKDPQDDSHINILEDPGVAFWADRFGVSPDELKAAVEKVGITAGDVRAELARGLTEFAHAPVGQ